MNVELLLNFMKDFDKDLEVVYIPEIQPIFCSEGIIFIGDDFENGADYFIDHMVEKHLCAPDLVKSLSIPMWSVLHEIGHYFTWDDEEWKKEQIARHLIDSVSKKEVLMSFESIRKKTQFHHFNLPLEWVATDWAIDYVETHLEELKKADKIIFG